MMRSLLSVTALLFVLGAPGQAQKTYATSFGGTLYELDFGAVTWTPVWSTGQTLLTGIAQQVGSVNELYMSAFQVGLFEVAVDTQTLTALGATAPKMATIALNEDNGQYYGTEWTGLYSVDPVNVTATLIGSYGLFGMYGLEYHRGLGRLLACNTFSSSLYSIDPATGAPTLIGAHGTTQVSGIWYDENSGRTFGVTDTNSLGQMLEFDVTTGQATVLATTGINFVGLGGAIDGGSVETFCYGDGTGALCPCGNFGAAGEGCGNSTGSGALLMGSGSTSVGVDDFQCVGAQLVPAQPALLFVGDNALNGGNGVLNGDGLRCAGGNLRRLGVRTPDALGAASWGPGLAAVGGWSAGDTRRLQIWYRNPAGSPCGTGFNLSNGLEVLFSL